MGLVVAALVAAIGVWSARNARRSEDGSVGPIDP
jgi:hypothetical protein